MLQRKAHLAAAVAAVALAAAGVALAGMAVGERPVESRIGVALREYRISLLRTVPPGRTTFVVTNRGRIVHAFEISGPGIGRRRIPGTIAPGKTKRLTVTLAPGRYTVRCPLPGHAARGLRASITVTAAAGTGTTAPPPPPTTETTTTAVTTIPTTESG